MMDLLTFEFLVAAATAVVVLGFMVLGLDERNKYLRTSNQKLNILLGDEIELTSRLKRVARAEIAELQTELSAASVEIYAQLKKISLQTDQLKTLDLQIERLKRRRRA